MERSSSFCNGREHFAPSILILLSRTEISGNSETFASMDQMKRLEGTFRNRRLTSTLLAVHLVILAGGIRSAAAATVWSGPIFTFTEPNFADWTQPANQDRLTPEDWITRDTTRGLFNAASESFYTKFSSPADTQWATGTLANYASLTYTDWQDWAGSHPPSTVGEQAVVHLIADDIYLSVKFDSWGGSAGGFSYERSTPSIVPEPSAGSMLLMGLLLAGLAQFLRSSMAASFSPRRLSRRPGTTPPQDRSDRSRTSSPSCRS